LLLKGLRRGGQRGEPQTLQIKGRSNFREKKEKGTVQSLHTRQPLSNGLSSLDCELVPNSKMLVQALSDSAT